MLPFEIQTCFLMFEIQTCFLIFEIQTCFLIFEIQTSFLIFEIQTCFLMFEIQTCFLIFEIQTCFLIFEFSDLLFIEDLHELSQEDLFSDLNNCSRKLIDRWLKCHILIIFFLNINSWSLILFEIIALRFYLIFIFPFFSFYFL